MPPFTLDSLEDDGAKRFFVELGLEVGRRRLNLTNSTSRDERSEGADDIFSVAGLDADGDRKGCGPV